MAADSFGTRSRLAVGDDGHDIFRLDRIKHCSLIVWATPVGVRLR